MGTALSSISKDVKQLLARWRSLLQGMPGPWPEGLGGRNLRNPKSPHLSEVLLCGEGCVEASLVAGQERTRP